MIRTEIKKVDTEVATEATCDACGKSIFVEICGGHHNLVGFTATQQWSYGSKFDGELHEFELCEGCYELMLERIGVTPRVTEVALI